jgi:restriction system protein
MAKEIPPFQDFFLPALRYLADNTEHRLKDIVEKVSVHFKFSDEQKKQLTPSGRQTTIYNRCQWTLTYLKNAELVKSTQRGWYQITQNGLDIANDKSRESLNVKDLYQSNNFSEFHGRKNYVEKKLDEINLDTQNKTPDEILDSAYQDIKDKLREELLEKIRNVSFMFFERLVVDLLVKMGYGGSVKDAGKAVGQAGDEGIDGIIKEDKLGLDIVYIQAKRWKENSKVTRPDIQSFVGALAGKGAKKGVFITASDFTDDARKYEPRNEIKIVLINGKELADLMIDYNLGVSLQQSYEIKKIDNDYFEEE